MPQGYVPKLDIPESLHCTKKSCLYNRLQYFRLKKKKIFGTQTKVLTLNGGFQRNRTLIPIFHGIPREFRYSCKR